MRIKIDKKQLEKIIPIGLPIIFLGANLFNVILVLRSLPVLLELGILRKLFVGTSKFLLPIGDVLYFFMAVKLAENWNKGKFFKILLVFVAIIGFCVLSLSFYFNYLEAANYPNFVFSQLHIYLPSLRFYASFQVLFLFVAFLSFLYYQFPRSKYLKIVSRGFFRGALILPLVIILYNNFLELPNIIYNETALYKKYISVSPEKRNKLPDLGDYYYKIAFVRSNTEENSVVIHPTQSVAFPDIGNQPLNRYSLFPRKLVTGKLENKFFSENKNYNETIYYIVAKGVDKDSVIYFPEHLIKAEEISVLYKDGQIKNFSNVEYSLEFVKNLGDFEIGVLTSK